MLTVNPDPSGFDIVGSISSNDTPLTSQNLELNQLPLFSSMQNAIADVGGWSGLTPNQVTSGSTTGGPAVTPWSWTTLGLVLVGLIFVAEIGGRHGR